MTAHITRILQALSFYGEWGAFHFVSYFATRFASNVYLADRSRATEEGDYLLFPPE